MHNFSGVGYILPDPEEEDVGDVELIWNTYSCGDMETLRMAFFDGSGG